MRHPSESVVVGRTTVPVVTRMNAALRNIVEITLGISTGPPVRDTPRKLHIDVTRGPRDVGGPLADRLIVGDDPVVGTASLGMTVLIDLVMTRRLSDTSALCTLR